MDMREGLGARIVAEALKRFLRTHPEQGIDAYAYNYAINPFLFSSQR
jgi:hypothetical protein